MIQIPEGVQQAAVPGIVLTQMLYLIRARRELKTPRAGSLNQCCSAEFVVRPVLAETLPPSVYASGSNRICFLSKSRDSRVSPS